MAPQLPTTATPTCQVRQPPGHGATDGSARAATLHGKLQHLIWQLLLATLMHMAPWPIRHTHAAALRRTHAILRACRCDAGHADHLLRASVQQRSGEPSASPRRAIATSKVKRRSLAAMVMRGHATCCVEHAHGRHAMPHLLARDDVEAGRPTPHCGAGVVEEGRLP